LKSAEHEHEKMKHRTATTGDDGMDRSKIADSGDGILTASGIGVQLQHMHLLHCSLFTLKISLHDCIFFPAAVVVAIDQQGRTSKVSLFIVIMLVMVGFS
jgi:hypothetical protein